MSRTLGSEYQTQISAEVAKCVRLLELAHSGGTLWITDSSDDIDALGFTFTALGGHFQVGQISETSDLSGQGVPLVLDGVDQTIIAAVLANDFRGREARIWNAHIKSDGTLADAAPELEARGFMNAAWRYKENRGEGVRAGTAKVETRIVSRLTELNRVRSVRTNTASHREMLVRGGFTGAALNDSIFKRVPKLVNKVIEWGEVPEADS
jgi:hypothetical protein